LPHYASPENIRLVTRHGIFTEAEFLARQEIHTEAYCKLMHIEAQTMVEMATRQILPAASRYCGDLSTRVESKKRLGIPCNAEFDLIKRLSEDIDKLYDATGRLKGQILLVPTQASEASRFYLSTIVPLMNEVRSLADELETLTDKAYWPFPTYSDILFY
jgi:glutamine synthetase